MFAFQKTSAEPLSFGVVSTDVQFRVSRGIYTDGKRRFRALTQHQTTILLCKDTAERNLHEQIVESLFRGVCVSISELCQLTVGGPAVLLVYASVRRVALIQRWSSRPMASHCELQVPPQFPLPLNTVSPVGLFALVYTVSAVSYLPS